LGAVDLGRDYHQTDCDKQIRAEHEGSVLFGIYAHGRCGRHPDKIRPTLVQFVRTSGKLCKDGSPRIGAPHSPFARIGFLHGQILSGDAATR
jgi:hypothetical protein